jgi:hypothetical protein
MDADLEFFPSKGFGESVLPMFGSVSAIPEEATGTGELRRDVDTAEVRRIGRHHDVGAGGPLDGGSTLGRGIGAKRANAKAARNKPVLLRRHAEIAGPGGRYLEAGGRFHVVVGRVQARQP